MNNKGRNNMEFVADLHLHSKYSRAVSRDMVLPVMAEFAQKKGIDILTTGDFTHPLWFREIRGQLEEAGEGVYQLKSQKEPLFLLTAEVASIYSQGGRLRRIHNLIFAPSFETAEKIIKEFQRRGVNLLSDGRPMMGITAKNVLEMVLGIDQRVLLIPCHIWTPWFSLYGSNSGFDSVEECFGDYAKYIYAIETGLSSDPEMNWRIKELENRSVLSFSDAHSPAKMGREATVFDLSEVSYENIRKAVVQNNIAYTIEFYPEEGKYHYTGHRNCKIVQSPEETVKNGTKCPVCGRGLTVGVMHRVEQLAVPQTQNSTLRLRSGRELKTQNDEYGVTWIKDPTKRYPPFVKLVPLLEIISEALFVTTASLKVKEAYNLLVEKLGSEIAVLLKTEILQIEKVAGKRVAEGIKKVRKGDISISPGFDGEYGKVKIWADSLGQEIETEEELVNNRMTQLGLEF